MKRQIALVLAVLAIMVGMLTGCGGGAEKKAALVGTWTATSMEMEGESIVFADYAELMGVDPEEVKITMSFTDDGKMSMDIMGESEEGTWKVKGDGYALSMDDAEELITLTDGKIVLEDAESEMTMVFEKDQ